MNTNWRRNFSGCIGGLAIATLVGGCVVHARPVVVGPPGVEIVDEHGYHHHGYYDDQHVWHGYYMDEHNVRHDDAPDWRHH
jgi:hypothetical protein